MKYLLCLFIPLLSALSIHAAFIEGDIKLAYSDSAFAKEVFKKEFGDVVKGTCNWYSGDFFGKETVFAGVTVKNTGAKPMFIHYYVSFYNKDRKLVGAAGQGSFGKDGLKPGEETMLGSCLIHLPKEKYKEIVSYQAIMYETDIAPAK